MEMVMSRRKSACIVLGLYSVATNIGLGQLLYNCTTRQTMIMVKKKDFVFFWGEKYETTVFDNVEDHNDEWVEDDIDEENNDEDEEEEEDEIKEGSRAWDDCIFKLFTGPASFCQAECNQVSKNMWILQSLRNWMILQIMLLWLFLRMFMKGVVMMKEKKHYVLN